MLTNIAAIHYNNLHTDLNSHHAVKVVRACFVDGDEGEHRVDFFRLWGSVIRRHYNRSNTVTTFQKVEGDDLELFNSYYPA